MKKLLFCVFAFLLVGCVQNMRSESGAPIDKNLVALIHKDQTTEQDILNWFGEPVEKTVVNETDTHWTYINAVSLVSTNTITLKTDTKTSRDVLDIIFRNGVVLNYTFSQHQDKPKHATYTTLY